MNLKGLFVLAVSLTEHPAHAMNLPRCQDVQQEARWDAKRAVPWWPVDDASRIRASMEVKLKRCQEGVVRYVAKFNPRFKAPY